ncbi:hypothetical protein WA158_006864 [Blastocystis sp. Blastoise]
MTRITKIESNKNAEQLKKSKVISTNKDTYSASELSPISLNKRKSVTPKRKKQSVSNRKRLSPVRSPTQRIKCFKNPEHNLYSEATYLELENDQIICTCCNCIINCYEMSFLTKHLTSKRHHTNMKQKELDEKEKTNNDEYMIVGKNAVKCMLDDGLKLSTFDGEGMKRFFRLYAKPNITIPSYKTLINKYVPLVYDENKNKIINIIQNKNISLFLDSTTDKKKQNVLNIMARVINEGYDQPIYLLKTFNLLDSSYKGYGSCIYCTIEEYSIDRNNILFIHSDNASNMLKLSEGLLIPFPNHKHIGCCCHIINLIATAMQKECSQSEKFIILINSYFSWYGNRQSRFQEFFNNKTIYITKPPSFVESRWNSFYNCLSYHAKYISYYPEFFAEECKLIKKNTKGEVIRKLLYDSKFQSLVLELNILKDIGTIYEKLIKYMSSDSFPIINMYMSMKYLHDNLEALDTMLKNRANDESQSQQNKKAYSSVITSLTNGITEALKKWKKYFNDGTNLNRIYSQFHFLNFKEINTADYVCLFDMNFNKDITNEEIKEYFSCVELYQLKHPRLDNKWGIENYTTIEELKLFFTSLPASLNAIYKFFQYAVNVPVSNTCVERSFSTYNRLLTKSRMNLSFDHTEKLLYIIINNKLINKRNEKAEQYSDDYDEPGTLYSIEHEDEEDTSVTDTLVRSEEKANNDELLV